MSSNRNTLLAFAIGAAMGGIAALLFAPEKGEVTRKRIKEGGARLADKGAAAVEHARTTVEEAGQAIGNSARRQTAAVGDAFAAAKETYVRESRGD